MKLSNYTVQTMKNEIQQFLFLKWLSGDLKDSKDPEIKELYKNYYAIMDKQIEIMK